MLEVPLHGALQCVVEAGGAFEAESLELRRVERVAAVVALAVGQPVTVVAGLTDRVKGIALPAEALVRNQANEPVVWIKSGAERFIAQPVEAKPVDGRTIVVIKGLAADNRVVVSGAALINQIR